jgi:hypothetical protein
MLEVDTKDVIKAFGRMFWLLEPLALTILVRRLYEFFWQFAGPHLVSMTVKGEREIIAAIKLLGDISARAVILEESNSLFKELGRSFKSFFSMGIDYRRSGITNAVKQQIDDIRRQARKRGFSGRKMKVTLAYLDDAVTGRVSRKVNAKSYH